MYRIGLRMLFGARGKYAALIFGLAFAVLLSTQQAAILLGVLDRSTGLMQNIGVADIWVVSRDSFSVDFVREMHDRQLAQVRSVPGVQWAEPVVLDKLSAELPGGSFCPVSILGIDRSSKIGRPPELLKGDLDSLDLPDTIFMEVSQRHRLPAIGMGGVLYFNGRRARVVGLCRARTGIEARPLFYASVENARRYLPAGEHRVSFILVKVKRTTDAAVVGKAIHRLPDITAYLADELRWKTMEFIVLKTGIGLNFAITTLLGFVVGLVLATAAFHQFTSDNLPCFAMLRAVGARDSTLIGIVLVQALTAGFIGYGIGIGLAGLLTLPGLASDAVLTSRFPWPLLLFGLVPMLACISMGSLISLRRVLRVDPVILFQ